MVSTVAPGSPATSAWANSVATEVNRIQSQILDVNGNPILKFSPTAAAVNHLQIQNNVSTGTPRILAVGADADVNMTLRTKGVGEIYLTSDVNGVILQVVPIPSAVNWVAIKNAVAGSSPIFGVDGDDTNIDLNLAPKGTGLVKANGEPLVTTNGAQILTQKTLTDPKINTINDSNGAGVLGFGPNGTPMANRLHIKNNSAGSYPEIGAVGTDSNIGIDLFPKGNAPVRINGVPVVVGSAAGTGTALALWKGTQAQYDAIGTKDGNTIYAITP